MCALQVLQHRQLPKNTSSIDLSFTSSSSILPSITSGRFSRSPESQQIGSPLNTSNDFTSKIAQISNQVRSNSKSRSAKRESINVVSRTSTRSLNSTQNMDDNNNNNNKNNISDLKLVTSSTSSDYDIPAAPPIKNNNSSSNTNSNVGSATFSIKVAVRIRPFNDREVQTYRAAKMIKAREEYIIATARAEQEQDERPALKRRGSQANLMLKELLKDVSGLTNNKSSNMIGTSASARLPFEKQLRHGTDSGGLSSRLNISHLISQSLLPNKNRSGASPSSSTSTTTTTAAVEVFGKDLERSLRSLVERDSDNQLNSANNGLDSFVGGANNNRMVNYMSATEVSTNMNAIDGIDMNDEPEPIIDVEPDQKTVLLLDPFHPGKAKGVFTFDFVVSSFAPSVEIADSIDTNGPSNSSSNQHKGNHDNNTITKNNNKKSSNALLRHKEKVNKAELEQLTLYNELALPLVEVLLRGYNACVFAYGQTSSGKTYTMFGTRDVPGIVPRMCKELFQQMASASSHDQSSLESLPNNASSTEHHEHKSHSKHKSKKCNSEEQEEEEEYEENERHKLQLASSLRGPLHALNGYTVVMSYLEIYNEQVRDLLHGCAGAVVSSGDNGNSCNSNNNGDNNNTNSSSSNNKKAGNGSSSNASTLLTRRGSAYMNFSTSSTFSNHLGLDNYDGRTLKVRTHPTNGVFVEGLSTFQVCSFEECERLLKHGNTSRTSSATAMNATSSRSHAILQLTITKKEELQGCKVRGQTVMLNNQTSKLNLVDLAGSERSNVDELPGSRHRIETNNINVSLSTLRRVIESLVSRFQALSGNSSSSSTMSKTLHLPPYRESVLTYLLSDNFGGNSRTVMCATVSPSEMNFAETESTLRYAAIARGIRLHVKVNESPAAKLIKSLQTRVALLSNELTKCMTSVISLERLKEIGVNPDNYINGKFALDCSRSMINMTSESSTSNNEMVAYWKNEANRQRHRADDLEQQLLQSKYLHDKESTEVNSKNPKLAIAELNKLTPHNNDKIALPNLRALAMGSPMFQHRRVTPLSLLNLRNASDFKALDTSAGQIRNSITNTSMESSGSRQSYLLGHPVRLPQFPSSSLCSSLAITHHDDQENRTSASNVVGKASETRRASNIKGSSNIKNNINNVNRNKINENNVTDNNNSISENSIDRSSMSKMREEAIVVADLNQRRPTLKPSTVTNITTANNNKDEDSENDKSNKSSSNANKKKINSIAARDNVNTSQELRNNNNNSNDKAVANRRVKRQSSDENSSVFSPRSSSQTSLSFTSDQDINAANKMKKSHHNKANVSMSPVEAAAVRGIEKGQWETEAVLQPSRTKKETKRSNKSREQNTEKLSQEMKSSVANNKYRKVSLCESVDSSMLENSSDEGVFEPVKKQIKENSLEEQLMQFQRAKMQNGVKK